LELSKNSWLLAIQFLDREQPSLYPIAGGDAEKLMAKLNAVQDRWAKESGARPMITLRSKGVHNAGCLRHEVIITYPFHPLVGQSVLVVGDREHGGSRYLIICDGNEARLLLPEWNSFPEAGTIQTLPRPRLSVTRLVELRALLDRLMALSSGTTFPEEDRAMRRWRPFQPDLFITPPPYDLPQRATVVKLLKALLAEVISESRKRRDAQSRGGQ
jgi:hypothetical protein